MIEDKKKMDSVEDNNECKMIFRRKSMRLTKTGDGNTIGRKVQKGRRKWGRIRGIEEDHKQGMLVEISRLQDWTRHEYGCLQVKKLHCK